MFESENYRSLRKRILLYIFSLALLVVVTSIGLALALPENYSTHNGVKDPEPLVYIGASLAVGLSCIGAGYALSSTVKAGFAAIVEKPELRGFFLIMAGLAEGIAIYGLLIAILMLLRG